MVDLAHWPTPSRLAEIFRTENTRKKPALVTDGFALDDKKSVERQKRNRETTQSTALLSISSAIRFIRVIRVIRVIRGYNTILEPNYSRTQRRYDKFSSTTPLSTDLERTLRRIRPDFRKSASLKPQARSPETNSLTVAAGVITG